MAIVVLASHRNTRLVPAYEEASGALVRAPVASYALAAVVGTERMDLLLVVHVSFDAACAYHSMNWGLRPLDRHCTDCSRLEHEGEQVVARTDARSSPISVAAAEVAVESEAVADIRSNSWTSDPVTERQGLLVRNYWSKTLACCDYHLEQASGLQEADIPFRAEDHSDKERDMRCEARSDHRKDH